MKLPALGQVIKENICPYIKIYGQYKKRSSHVTATLAVHYCSLMLTPKGTHAKLA